MRILARLHKYVALAVGFLVASMGLTGSVLVFKADFEERLHPERRVAVIAGSQPSFERMLQSARTAVPGAREYVINRPDQPDRAFNVDVAGVEERHLFVDPYSGRLVANTAEDELALDWVAQLHTRLLAGTTGKYAVAAIGAVLLFLAISGLVLWWPRKWKQALRVRWDAPRLGLNYDLHRAAGAIFAAFFLISATTGITLAFSAPAARLVGAIAGAPPPPVPKLPPRAPGVPRLSLDRVVEAAQGAFPQGRLKRVIVPAHDAPVLVRMQAAGDHHPNGLNRIYVDPYTASVLAIVPIATASPGLRMFDWLYPLHIGALFGPAHGAVQVVVGLAPAFLLATGLIVWWSSRKARRKAMKARTRADAAPMSAKLQGKAECRR